MFYCWCCLVLGLLHFKSKIFGSLQHSEPPHCFHSGCPYLHPFPQCTELPTSTASPGSSLCQFDNAVLKRVKCYLTVVLIYTLRNEKGKKLSYDLAYTYMLARYIWKGTWYSKETCMLWHNNKEMETMSIYSYMNTNSTVHMCRGTLFSHKK